MNFEQSLQHVFKAEGGFSNDPTDRGGKTNFGISSKAYPGLDVSKLTKEDAAALYKKDYWDKIDADNLPEDLRLIAFDTAVNHGPRAAVDMIRNANFDPNAIIEQRRIKYANIIAKDPSQAKFAKGWENRLAGISPKQAAANNTVVAKSVAQDNSSGRTLQDLRDAGEGEWIDAAIANGWPVDAIIKELAPQGVVAGQAALDRSNKRGVVGRTVDSVKDRAGDYVMAGRQLESIVTGNDAELAVERKQQAANQNDLDRVARSGNLGGLAADVALSAPLAFVPGGLALKIAVMAAFNAAQAGTYADEDGKMFDPTTMAVGGAIVPAGVVAGKVLQKTISGAKRAATDIGTRPVRVAAARGEEIGTVKGWAAQDMGIDPVKAATMSAQEISESGVNNARRLLENSMEGLTTKVDDDILAAVNKQRGAAGLGLVDGANVSMRDLDGLRRLVSSEARTSANQFTKDGLKPLEEKIAKAIEDGFAQAPEKYNQFLTGKKYYDNWRVWDKFVSSTNNVETELLNPTKLASAMKGAARSRFSRGDAPMQNVLDRLQEAKGQSALVKGGTAKALEFIGNAAEWVPGIGIPARLLRHTRMAKTVVDSLSDPVVRAAFQRDLAPSVQAQIYRAAAMPTTPAAPASVLKKATAVKQSAGKSTILVDSQGRAGTATAFDSEKLFPTRPAWEPSNPVVDTLGPRNEAAAAQRAAEFEAMKAKYAPQAADVVEVPVTAVEAPSVLPQSRMAGKSPEEIVNMLRARQGLGPKDNNATQSIAEQLNARIPEVVDAPVNDSAQLTIAMLERQLSRKNLSMESRIKFEQQYAAALKGNSLSGPTRDMTMPKQVVEAPVAVKAAPVVEPVKEAKVLKKSAKSKTPQIIEDLPREQWSPAMQLADSPEYKEWVMGKLNKKAAGGKITVTGVEFTPEEYFAAMEKDNPLTGTSTFASANRRYHKERGIGDGMTKNGVHTAYDDVPGKTKEEYFKLIAQVSDITTTSEDALKKLLKEVRKEIKAAEEAAKAAAGKPG